MSCPACDDGEGGCIYPYYGCAPHTCFYKLGRPPGGSEEAPESEWPENFVLDPEAGPRTRTGYPRAGTWTHCLECGAPLAGKARVNPPPTPSTGDVWAEVIASPVARLVPAALVADCRARRELGIARYGVPLQRGNGRDTTLDAYEEGLDLLAYLYAARAPILLRLGAWAVLVGVWGWRGR